ncbi:MAG TPA: hypothetical protein VM536_15950 [Chloroflexia bacterium]|nr:hypothetical protein [Chloroflexia bacterium]
MSNQLFRKTSLDRLSSPEQLDELMHVTSPRAWMALAAFGGLLAAALIWSLVAVIPTTVPGRGVLAPVSGQAGALQAVLFVSIEDSKKIRAGQEAKISLSAVQKSEFGVLQGRVRTVADLPASQQEMLDVIGKDAYVQALAGEGAIVQVVVDLIPDPSSASGYNWSSNRGAGFKLQDGMIASATVTINEQRPIGLVFSQ